jgi:DNA (cytosine-5)-methyltransferase 1
MTSPLRLIDLFAGCGGLTAGFTSTASFEVIGAVEVDVYAAASYAANFGADHMFVGDIAEWVRTGPPRADVIIGGPPCQGFSALGTRYNRDPRNALWRRYVETVAAAEPRAFVVENVGAFLRSGQFRSLRRETYRGGILRDYRIEAGVLNAADYGTAQVRRRAIVIGTHRDLPPAGLPESTHPEDRWVSVREALRGLPHRVSELSLPDTYVSILGRTVPGTFKHLDIHISRRFTDLSAERYRCIPAGGNRHDLPHHLQAPCWRDHTSGSVDVMGRLVWDRPSVTIRTEFHKPEKGRYLHPSEHRPLTHLEAARLQGFPDNFTWCGPKIAIARQIGNAVPVPLATAVAEHLVARLT